MADEVTTPEKEEGADAPPYKPREENVVSRADNPDAVQNALNAERKAAREASKRAEAAEAKVAEYENANASEVEKQTKRAERAEKRADEADAKLLRFEVAVEKKVPPELTPLLTGSTKEELETQATLLLENIKTAPDFDGGARTPAPEAQSPEQEHNKFLADIFGRPRQP